MSGSYLDKVYEVATQDERTALYDAWAESYDGEVGGAGYATPKRAARALARLLRTGEAETLDVLDYGCGTGLSGRALAAEGFTRIDGCDPSAGMLKQAAASGAYRDLWQLDLDDPLKRDFRHAYDVIASVGVISTGAAPASVLPFLFGALKQGGRLVFSYNSHTLDDPDYMGALDAVLDNDHAILELSEDGDHLPEIGLTSRVMVLRYE